MPTHWSPPPKGCLKLDMDARYTEGNATITILVRDDGGKVKGLWFEKTNYVKIIIKSDCKVIVDVVLGYSSCPWSITSLVENIKLYLEDFPYVYILWINHLGNMAAYERTH